MKLWIVNGDGYFSVNASVVAETSEAALEQVQERVTKQISDFVGASLVDVRRKVKAGSWTSVEATPGIKKIDWDWVPKKPRSVAM